MDVEEPESSKLQRTFKEDGGGGVIPVQNAGKEGRGSVRIATMNGCLRVAPTEEEEEEGRTSSMCKWPAARQPTIEVF